MKDTLTFTDLMRVADTLRDIPARFVLHDDEDRRFWFGTLKRLEDAEPATSLVRPIFGMPIVLNTDVPRGEAHVQDAFGKVLKTIHLFEVEP